jgi:Xaa-Pro aminopeptidase
MSPTSFSRLAALLAERSADAAFIDDPSDVFYLTRFPSTYLLVLVTRRKTYLVTDMRYKLEIEGRKDLMKQCELVVRTGGSALEQLLRRTGVSSVLVDPDSLTLRSFEDLKKKLPDVRFSAEAGLVKGLRLVKARDEIGTVGRALAMAERSLAETLPFIREGVSEREIRTELEYRFARNGADKVAFDTIIASGPNAASPHAHVSDRKVRNREMIIMDFGVCLNGYQSDITRTVFLGRPDRLYALRYKAVREAMLRAEERIRAGMTAKAADAVARDSLRRGGLEGYFTHSLGHGVGVQIHERPFLNPSSPETLKKGMVVTVEPGIYVKGWGGIRIEDMVVVGQGGSRVLTRFPSGMIVL